MQTSRRAPLRSYSPLLLGVLALTLVAASPVRAQYFDPFDEVISPRAIVWRLNDRGFTEIGRPRFDGRAYVVDAESPNGGRVRLVVDARDGAVIGRVRLGPPLPPARVDRFGNAYGWTEEDVGLRRQEAERLIPPANIPSTAVPARRPPLRGMEADRPVSDRVETARRTDPVDANASGLNPDAVRRNPEPARKVVRLAPQAKPSDVKSRERGSEAARTVPEAPVPTLRPAEAQAPAIKPEQPVTATEPPKAAPTPAAVQPPSRETAAAPADVKPPTQSWTDPPAENKRTVRVIDGATVVPGTSGSAAGTAE